MHNILTLRGAQVRDALQVGRVPQRDDRRSTARTSRSSSRATTGRCGATRKIIDYWKKQRDLYKYIHDQSVRLMNKGYTGTEIAEQIKLPPELEQGLVQPRLLRHGAATTRAPSTSATWAGTTATRPTLDQLPPEEAAKKYVEYMGGEAAMLQKAKADFDKGEYRWVAEALKQVVFADPNSKDGQGPARRRL